jgi:transcriptional regulator with XRE-family HTH domain
MVQNTEQKPVELQRETKVGRRLNELRKGAKLSILELAARAGVSSGMISQVERGMTNPSIKTLEKLHIALSVPLTALLEDEPPPLAADAVDVTDIVRRSNDRPFLRVGKQGMTKEILSPRGDHHLEMMLIHLPPGASSDEVLIGEGEKAGWVMSGSIALIVENRTTELSEGDSFQFSSSYRHSIRNTGSVEAQVLWIMYVKMARPHL